SEEGGGVPCMGILPGTVKRFPAENGLKVPQIGWNDVTFKYDHPLLDGIPGGSYFYFVHGYYADPSQPGITIGEAEYGLDFAEIARHWEAEGAARLHVVDLDGARDGLRGNASVISRLIGTVRIPVQVGGGIRSKRTASEIVSDGADRVVVGTAAAEHPETLSE